MLPAWAHAQPRRGTCGSFQQWQASCGRITRLGTSIEFAAVEIYVVSCLVWDNVLLMIAVSNQVNWLACKLTPASSKATPACCGGAPYAIPMWDGTNAAANSYVPGNGGSGLLAGLNKRRAGWGSLSVVIRCRLKRQWLLLSDYLPSIDTFLPSIQVTMLLVSHCSSQIYVCVPIGTCQVPGPFVPIVSSTSAWRRTVLERALEPVRETAKPDVRQAERAIDCRSIMV